MYDMVIFIVVPVSLASPPQTNEVPFLNMLQDIAKIGEPGDLIVHCFHGSFSR